MTKGQRIPLVFMQESLRVRRVAEIQRGHGRHSPSPDESALSDFLRLLNVLLSGTHGIEWAKLHPRNCLADRGEISHPDVRERSAI